MTLPSELCKAFAPKDSDFESPEQRLGFMRTLRDSPHVIAQRIPYSKIEACAMNLMCKGKLDYFICNDTEGAPGEIVKYLRQHFSNELELIP